jgi:hypothetical protein
MNLRHVLPKSRWTKLRQQLIGDRGLQCQTCGIDETATSRIFVHEDWEYDTTRSPAVASLIGLKLSCWHCHAVAHFGATTNMALSGELDDRAIREAVDHFCRLNGVGRDVFDAHLEEAKAEWQQLSELEWQVDWRDFGYLVADTENRRTR